MMRCCRTRLHGSFLISLIFINKYTGILNLFPLQQANKRSVKLLEGDSVELELRLAVIPEKLGLDIGAVTLTGLCILWRK